MWLGGIQDMDTWLDSVDPVYFLLFLSFAVRPVKVGNRNAAHERLLVRSHVGV